MTEAEVMFESAGVSTESLATLGEGHIAYVKQIRSCLHCMPPTARRSCSPTAGKPRSPMHGAMNCRPSAFTDPHLRRSLT
jgi:hypothetical protein